MYTIKEIKEALKLLSIYDYAYTKVSRKLSIPVSTLRMWHKKEINSIPLVNKRRNRKKKWSDEEIKLILDYYFEHGENANKTVRKFGYPAYSTFILWIHTDKRYKKNIIYTPNNKSYAFIEKKKAIIDSSLEHHTVSGIARKYGVSRTTIYNWRDELIGDPELKKVAKKKPSHNKCELLKQIEILKEEQYKLQLENDILKKANELLKKEMGASYENLNNKEKTIVISALKSKYKIVDLLKILHLKKSTYYYEMSVLNYDKYEKVRPMIKRLFKDNYSCYGYRRIKIALHKEYGINISEKVIMRIMKEENLCVYIPRSMKKYSSYKGEITPSVPNIIHRNFKAAAPFEKVLTDITEFGMCDGKVYLSPLIDCFDGLPITWTIGTSPNTHLTNTMLKQAYELIKDTKMIIHSDRGVHYRVPSWIKLMDTYGYIRSMSKKGCSPDNSMCEGFFGTIKNEFFYSRNWKNTTCKEFMIELNEYLKWFATKRVKCRLVEKV